MSPDPPSVLLLSYSFHELSAGLTPRHSTHISQEMLTEGQYFRSLPGIPDPVRQPYPYISPHMSQNDPLEMQAGSWCPSPQNPARAPCVVLSKSQRKLGRCQGSPLCSGAPALLASLSCLLFLSLLLHLCLASLLFHTCVQATLLSQGFCTCNYLHTQLTGLLITFKS